MAVVPYLADLNEVRAWIEVNPCPDPSEDLLGCERWLYDYWYMDQGVDEASLDDPARPFVPWMDLMAQDGPHPVSEIARRFLEWQQPCFEF